MTIERTEINMTVVIKNHFIANIPSTKKSYEKKSYSAM